MIAAVEKIFVRHSLLHGLLLDMAECGEIVQHLTPRTLRYSHRRSFFQSTDLLKREGDYPSMAVELWVLRARESFCNEGITAPESLLPECVPAGQRCLPPGRAGLRDGELRLVAHAAQAANWSTLVKHQSSIGQDAESFPAQRFCGSSIRSRRRIACRGQQRANRLGCTFLRSLPCNLR